MELQVEAATWPFRRLEPGHLEKVSLLRYRGGRGGGWEGECVAPSALAQSSGQAGECPALPVVRDLIRRSGGLSHTPRPASRPADVLAEEGGR